MAQPCFNAPADFRYSLYIDSAKQVSCTTGWQPSRASTSSTTTGLTRTGRLSSRTWASTGYGCGTTSTPSSQRSCSWPWRSAVWTCRPASSRTPGPTSRSSSRTCPLGPGSSPASSSSSSRPRVRGSGTASRRRGHSEIFSDSSRCFHLIGVLVEA